MSIPRTRNDNRAIEDALRRAGAPAQAGRRAATASSRAAAAARALSDRAAAEGLADVSYASVDSPFGPLLAATTRRGLVRLAFPEEDIDATLEGLARRLSPRIVETSAPLDPVRRELDEYFGGRRREFDL